MSVNTVLTALEVVRKNLATSSEWDPDDIMQMLNIIRDLQKALNNADITRFDQLADRYLSVHSGCTIEVLTQLFHQLNIEHRGQLTAELQAV